MHTISIESLMVLQDTFKAHPTDIYLATMLKSGTTWLKELVYALANRNQYKNNGIPTHPLLVSNPIDGYPSLKSKF
ncbi:putative Sulfotransferase domain, P-loop containing nucleoside triphosphate hydrolase [Helianthus anomalus]